MTFGPACERCGACSYEGSMDKQPAKCPFCHKYKRRGSREELVAMLNEAKHTLYSVVGYFADMSICNEEQIKARCVDQIKAIDDV